MATSTDPDTRRRGLKVLPGVLRNPNEAYDDPASEQAQAARALVLDVLLKYEDTRAEAADALAALGGRAMVVAKLADPDAQVRRAALQALRRIPGDPVESYADPNARVKRMASFLKDPDPAVRAVAVAGTAWFFRPNIRFTAPVQISLQHALADALADPDAGVRKAAVVAFHKHHPTLLVGEQMVKAAQDADPEVALAACEALLVIDPPEADKAFAALIGAKDPAVRIAAMAAVDPGAWRRSRPREVRRDVVAPAVAEAMREANAQVRDTALRVYPELLIIPATVAATPGAVDTVAALARDTDPEVRRRAVWVAGHLAGVPRIQDDVRAGGT